MKKISNLQRQLSEMKGELISAQTESKDITRDYKNMVQTKDSQIQQMTEKTHVLSVQTLELEMALEEKEVHEVTQKDQGGRRTDNSHDHAKIQGRSSNSSTVKGKISELNGQKSQGQNSMKRQHDQRV